MASFFRFTKEDLESAREIPVLRERLEWLRECAARTDRPRLVHRTYWDDPHAHEVIRHGLEVIGQEFYDTGRLTPANKFVLDTLYQATVY